MLDILTSVSSSMYFKYCVSTIIAILNVQYMAYYVTAIVYCK